MSKPSPEPASDPTTIQRIRLVRQAMTKPATPTTIQQMPPGYQSQHNSASRQHQPATPIQGFKHWLTQHPTRRIQK